MKQTDILATYQPALNIKTWAEEDRPREKLLLKGKAALSDAELIAILIGSGTPKLTAVDVAKLILAAVNNDLKSAYAGTENSPFKVLLSHDPSHWDGEINQLYQDIDLTLSGHTHGMQFGVNIPGLKWSPVQYMYKQWAGLYQKGKQYLYVNTGLGFIGYPGRVGFLPEITVFELKKA